MPVVERRFHDPRIATGPIVPAARDQAHAVAVALQPEAIAVILDLVEPVGAVRNADGLGRDAELKRLKHGQKIGVPAENSDPAVLMV